MNILEELKGEFQGLPEKTIPHTVLMDRIKWEEFTQEILYNPKLLKSDLRASFLKEMKEEDNTLPVFFKCKSLGITYRMNVYIKGIRIMYKSGVKRRVP
jgi:hypothetical protein